MPRVVIISLVILSALLFFAFKAKQSGQQTLATALFAAAGIYSLIMLGGFSGLIGG